MMTKLVYRILPKWKYLGYCKVLLKCGCICLDSCHGSGRKGHWDPGALGSWKVSECITRIPSGCLYVTSPTASQLSKVTVLCPGAQVARRAHHSALSHSGSEGYQHRRPGRGGGASQEPQQRTSLHYILTLYFL